MRSYTHQSIINHELKVFRVLSDHFEQFSRKKRHLSKHMSNTKTFCNDIDKDICSKNSSSHYIVISFEMNPVFMNTI